MPLIPGKSKAAFKANVRELSGPDAKPRPLRQILAIAYDEQRRRKKEMSK